MAKSSPTVVLLGGIGAETSRALRAALLHALTFDTYRSHFAAAGVTENEVRLGDPIDVLRRMPVTTPAVLDALADESIAVSEGIVDIEVSSGTTGAPKRRPITAEDEGTETELLARLFSICGIGPADRVACVDTGPLTLMASFTGALERLGVGEAYAYTVSSDVDATADGLIALDPTTVITIPSIIERYLDVLEAKIAPGRATALSKLVYAGEPLSPTTRHRLEHRIGLEVFAYYGASETSALGVECGRHNGIHMLTENHVIELAHEGHVQGDAGIIVTTLFQKGLPLVRYPVGDVIRPRDVACPCGLELPLVGIVGRADATASVLATKLSYTSLRNSVYQGRDGPQELEVFLARRATEVITLRLPASLRDAESRIRRTFLRREPELAFLVGAGFLTIELEFVDDGYFKASRKQRQIVDLRDDGL